MKVVTDNPKPQIKPIVLSQLNKLVIESVNIFQKTKENQK